MGGMKAAVLHRHGTTDAIRVEEVPIPEPSDNEVRLRVRACALNWLDVGIRRGPKFGTVPLPLITGSDIAGIVDAVGTGVSDCRIGDEVIVYPMIVCGKCEFCLRGEPTTCLPNRQICLFLKLRLLLANAGHLQGGAAAGDHSRKSTSS